MSVPGTGGFVTGGIDSKEWYGSACVRHTIKEKVSGTGLNAYLTMAKTIPANSRIVSATLRAATNISFGLGLNQTDTTAAQALTTPKLGVAMIWTAPSSATGSSTSALVTLLANTAVTAGSAAISSGISQNATGARAFDTTVAAANGLILPTTLNLPVTLHTGTAARTLYIAPYGATTAADTVYRFAGTVTTSYTFGTSSTNAAYSFDVQVVYEELPESAAY